MENGWNLFNNNSSSSCVARGNHNDNCTSNDACAFWESGTTSSRIIDWNNNLQNPFNHVTTTTATAGMVSSTGPATVVASSTSREEEVAVHALMFNNGHYSSSVSSSVSSPFSSCLYSRGGSHSHCYPDPHLMCLKLGKRHYFGEATPLGDRQGAAASSAADAGFSNTIITKRGKPYYDAAGLIGPSTSSAGVTAAATPAVVPRCQVDGCHVALLNAKDYHRRHKVCEMHSKAPKVVVLGHEQRFCQQCSRFHAVGEFDESKRSCRRRLAGHNERRRKSSQDQSAPRNHSQVNGKLIAFGGRHPHFPLSSGCALSLLSSKNDSWISSSDLPARCSAALRELIAENRAAILSRQLILDKDLHWHHHHHPTEDLNGRQNGSNSHVNFQQPMATGSHSWDHRISEEAEGHVTLDLMQAPNSAFGFLSVREKSNEDEECPELWGSFGGAHVV